MEITEIKWHEVTRTAGVWLCGQSVTVDGHQGDLGVEDRNGGCVDGDAVTALDRRFLHQTVDDHGGVVGHIVQVLVNSHGLLATLDISLDMAELS